MKVKKLIALILLMNVITFKGAPEERNAQRLTHNGKNAKEWSGSWDQLQKKNFRNWEVASYSSSGVADGGSLSIDFTTVNGREFGLLVAHPSYWMRGITNEKLKNEKQVFYLTENARTRPTFYEIVEDSGEEKIVLEILSKAVRNAQFKKTTDFDNLKLVVTHLRSREVFPLFFMVD